MFSRRNDNIIKTKFIEDLNKILSLENAALERLERRIHEATAKSSQNSLQLQIREKKEQHNRLRKLIAYHGGNPTNSKADLLSLNSLTDATMDTMKDTMTNSKSNTFDGGKTESDNIPSITPQEAEILNMKEDVLIKKVEISAYKKVIKIAKKVNDKNTTIVLKQNLKENESTYDKIKTFEHEMFNEIKGNDTAHHEYFNLGSTIADMLTSYWNSKENPSKMYLFNRRVHHGTIGALFGLSGLYKNNPMIMDILSGLGAGLQRDDYNDFKEWWLFKKKEDDAREK